MARYIDADALKARLDYCVTKGMGSTIAFTFKHMIDEEPTAELPIKEKCCVCPHCDNCDVNEDGIIERKKGEWIACDHDKWMHGVYALRCSNCNGGYHLSTEQTIGTWDFCPTCGADMRKGVE